MGKVDTSHYLTVVHSCYSYYLIESNGFARFLIARHPGRLQFDHELDCDAVRDTAAADTHAGEPGRSASG